jgi:hypothetical protein
MPNIITIATFFRVNSMPRKSELVILMEGSVTNCDWWRICYDNVLMLYIGRFSRLSLVIAS